MPRGVNELPFRVMVNFIPELVAKNPEKAREAALAYRARSERIEEQMIQIEKELAKKYGLDESQLPSRIGQFRDLSSEEQKQLREKALKTLKRMRRFSRLKKASRRLRRFFYRHF